jgi:hypothetical protein
MPSTFSRSDAWVLAAAIHAGGSPDLSLIVAAADIIDHAVLEPEELAGALVRLSSVGLVERIGPAVRLVGPAETLARSLRGKRVQLLSLIDKCDRLLATRTPPALVALDAFAVSQASAAIAGYVAMPQRVVGQSQHET